MKELVLSSYKRYPSRGFGNNIASVFPYSADRLERSTNMIEISFLCRHCKWLGRNDHWAASRSGHQFRCCNCGFQYRAVVNTKDIGKRLK